MAKEYIFGCLSYDTKVCKNYPSCAYAEDGFFIYKTLGEPRGEYLTDEGFIIYNDARFPKQVNQECGKGTYVPNKLIYYMKKVKFGIKNE